MDNYFDCVVKVEKVLRYGSSTKPIGKGTELKLYFTFEQKNLIDLIDEGTSTQHYEFTVEQETMVNEPSNQLKYRVLNINNVGSDKQPGE